MIRAFRAVALALSLVLCPLCANADGASQQTGTKLAYFQAKNIFRSGLQDTHTVALTFDDGPNANTVAVLDELKSYGVKATFFVVGAMARTHRDILARIAREGHLLANHSATHPLLGDEYASHPDMLVEQIRDVDNLIAPLMPPGAKFYFRSPFGSWRSVHANVLNSDPVLRKYVGPIYWDEGGDIEMSDDGYVMSAADWDCWRRHWDADTCAKGYLREIQRKNGGVVLMHCIHTQSAALVAGVVPSLIDEGYSFVRVDQIENYQQYETPSQPAEPVVASVGLNGRVTAR